MWLNFVDLCEIWFWWTQMYGMSSRMTAGQRKACLHWSTKTGVIWWSIKSTSALRISGDMPDMKPFSSSSSYSPLSFNLLLPLLLASLFAAKSMTLKTCNAATPTVIHPNFRAPHQSQPVMPTHTPKGESANLYSWIFMFAKSAFHGEW